MSVGQLVGGVATLGIVGGLLNEVTGYDKPRQPDAQDKPETPRSTSYCKTVLGTAAGIVAGLSLMDAFDDARDREISGPALASPTAQPQIAATPTVATPINPALNPFLSGPTFTPGFMG